MSAQADLPEDPTDPILGHSIASIVNMPLVTEDDLRSQAEVDQLVACALLGQAQREYAGAKALLHLMTEVCPEYDGVEVFRGKVRTTRRVVELFDRLTKTGLADPEAPTSPITTVDDE